MSDSLLSRERALIFRITHRDNVPWLLRNGLHCASSPILDPNFVSIGNPEIIQGRQVRPVPISPRGTLHDYIPFYFTPWSPMLYNISTGYGGITQRRNEEIVVLVSSLDLLEERGLPYVFTDRHAYLNTARFFRDRAKLQQVDFELLGRRDFQRDPEDPGKLERYQAEVLVHGPMPVSGLLGLACYTETVKGEIQAECSCLDLELPIAVRSHWYFR